jgi:hypothetical protein
MPKHLTWFDQQVVVCLGGYGMEINPWLGLAGCDHYQAKKVGPRDARQGGQ